MAGICHNDFTRLLQQQRYLQIWIPVISKSGLDDVGISVRTWSDVSGRDVSGKPAGQDCLIHSRSAAIRDGLAAELRGRGRSGSGMPLPRHRAHEAMERNSGHTSLPVYDPAQSLRRSRREGGERPRGDFRRNRSACAGGEAFADDAARDRRSRLGTGRAVVRAARGSSPDRLGGNVLRGYRSDFEHPEGNRYVAPVSRPRHAEAAHVRR